MISPTVYGLLRSQEKRTGSKGLSALGGSGQSPAFPYLGVYAADSPLEPGTRQFCALVIALRFCAQASGVEPIAVGRSLP